MAKQLHKTTLMLLMAAMVVCAGNAFALQLTDLDGAQREYDSTTTERQRLIQQLEGLEGRYQGLVSKIEALKSRGGISTIGGRIELQNLLTQSKAIADELAAFQTRVRSLDNRLAGQRSGLVQGLDRRLGELERSLGSSSASSRRAIVLELNALRKRRAAYTTPLPSAPSSREVDSALHLADEAAHPRELMAAADELQDTEDQLRKRLEAIDAKLTDLRKTRTLVRRARSFSREEKFFEETDRERVIARYEKVTVKNSNPTEPAPGEDPAVVSNDQANTGSAATGGGNNSAAGNNAFDDADGMGAAPASAPDPDGDFSAERTSAPSLSDSATGAEVASGQTPFETSRETIIIDGGSDPSRAVGSLGVARGDVDGQIRKLKREQKKLNKQARELKKRAGELRKRAADM